MSLKTHDLNDVIIHFSVLELKCRKAQCWQMKKEEGFHLVGVHKFLRLCGERHIN